MNCLLLAVSLLLAVFVSDNPLWPRLAPARDLRGGQGPGQDGFSGVFRTQYFLRQDGISLTADVLSDGQSILWKTINFSEIKIDKYWFYIHKQWPYANKQKVLLYGDEMQSVDHLNLVMLLLWVPPTSH